MHCNAQWEAMARWYTWTICEEKHFCPKMDRLPYKSSLTPERCQDTEK